MNTRWPINEFHIQVLILELLLCTNLRKRSRFWLRFLPFTAAYLILPHLIPGGFLSPYLSIGWFQFSFLIMFILSAGLLFFCFQIDIKQLIFCCCVAHTLQHIVHCAARVFSLAFVLSGIPSQAVECLLMFFAFLAVQFLFRTHLFTNQTAEAKNINILSFGVISTLIVYFVSYWTTSYEGETIGEHFFDLFACALLLIVLFDGFRIRKAERDQLIMLRLLRQEQEQNKLSKTTVEVINRKCHDLKHQISALRTMTDKEKEKSITDLERAVLIYDRFPKTGSNDLDLILAEKSLIAEKQQITLQCIADGEKISFMQTEDIYSLLGNALDNAIEAAGQEPVAENRIITLKLFEKSGFLYLHLENPCKTRPVFADGLPLTSKSDVDYHGFGVKSMRFIAEKYQGALTTGWEEGVFSLDVIFPRQPLLP
ncbi:MAG: sensor histidine kinase [Blautia sp.]|nr:sensor histidine kinase [Blautia sp.]